MLILNQPVFTEYNFFFINVTHDVIANICFVNNKQLKHSVTQYIVFLKLRTEFYKFRLSNKTVYLDMNLEMMYH